jgi:hypothetical protein
LSWSEIRQIFEGKNPGDIHTSVAANFVNKVTRKEQTKNFSYLYSIPKVSNYREVKDEKVGGVPHLGVEDHDQHHQQVTQES